MRRLTIVMLVIVLVLTVAACGSREAKTKAPKPKAPAHHLTKAIQKQILKDTGKDLQIVMATRDDTAGLDAALSGDALKQFGAKIKTDLAAGKIKVRKYGDLKLKLINYTSGVAGISIEFIDQSYYTDLKGNTLGPPPNTRQKLSLAVQRISNQWKIINTFAPGGQQKARQPAPSKPPSSPKR